MGTKEDRGLKPIYDVVFIRIQGKGEEERKRKTYTEVHREDTEVHRVKELLCVTVWFSGKAEGERRKVMAQGSGRRAQG